jgi:hypothetical protein
MENDLEAGGLTEEPPCRNLPGSTKETRKPESLCPTLFDPGTSHIAALVNQVGRVAAAGGSALEASRRVTAYGSALEASRRVTEHMGLLLRHLGESQSIQVCS